MGQSSGPAAKPSWIRRKCSALAIIRKTSQHLVSCHSLRHAIARDLCQQCCQKRGKIYTFATTDHKGTQGPKAGPPNAFQKHQNYRFTKHPFLLLLVQEVCVSRQCFGCCGSQRWRCCQQISRVLIESGLHRPRRTRLSSPPYFQG